MTTKSHYDFGNYLLKNYVQFNSDSANTAFLLGCVEPDVNVATYLRGSLSYQFLRGHNYPNLMPYVKMLHKKLQHCVKKDFVYYYRIGKLVHYLTDAFTYPHNSIFTGNLHEHIRYEQELESRFKSTMPIQLKKPKIYELDHLYSYFRAAHDVYLKSRPGAETDMYFILNIIPTTVVSLFAAVPITHVKKKNAGTYESSFNI